LEQSISNRDIAERSVNAALWGILGTLLRVLLQVGAQVALARLLGPDPFGLFAVALVVVLFSGFFADVGLSYGLIQRKSVTDTDIRFVFTWQMVLGAAVTVAIFSIAAPVAAFYADPRLVRVLQWLSLTCVVNAFGSTSNALLRRAMDFRTLQLAAVFSYLVGFFAVGIPLALTGFAVEALVAAFLVQSALAAGIAFLRARHPIRPLFSHHDARGILGFGATVLGTNLVNWAMTSLDRIIVGRTLSISAAGLYSTMHNFITAPTVQVLSVVQGVLYSASANVQESRRRLRKGFRTMFGAVGLFVTPVFFAVAAVADTFVQVVYGQKWVGGEVVLAPLAVAMPAFLLMGMAVPVLWASGQTKQEFRLQIPLAFVWAIVLLGVAQTRSLAWLSWAVCLLYYARAVIIVAATCRAVHIPVAIVPRLLKAGAVVTGIVTGVAWFADRGLAVLVGSPHARLPLVILACAAALVASIRLASPLIRADVRALLARIAARIPRGIGTRALAAVLRSPAVRSRPGAAS
jgi:O-antigen/teichoic acid export membrane protein